MQVYEQIYTSCNDDASNWYQLYKIVHASVRFDSRLIPGQKVKYFYGPPDYKVHVYVVS